MEGHFSYTINGVERKMFFGNYALEQTLSDMNASVTEVSDILNTKLLPFIRTFVYHAACYPVLKEGKEPDFTAFDIHEWIDSSGGTSGEFIQQASKKIYACLGVGEASETSQKKSKSNP
jgi:hypothetical protein